MLQIKEFSEAAGLGFEPRLTDPESVSTLSWLFTAVQKTAFSSQNVRNWCFLLFAVVHPRNCQISVKLPSYPRQSATQKPIGRTASVPLSCREEPFSAVRE